MRVKEISIRPFETPDAKMVWEVWEDEGETTPIQIWELTCTDLAQIDGIPQSATPIFMFTEDRCRRLMRQEMNDVTQATIY